MPHVPSHPADRLHDAAVADAKRTRKTRAQSAPRTLSEREQLRQYQDRLKQGVDGFKDVVDQHGMTGLARYQSAMRRLATRYHVKLEG